MSVAEKIQQVRLKIDEAAIRSGREPSAVSLVAVSKTVPVEHIREAIAAGQNLFGENYVQEAEAKFSELPSDVRLHCTGALQRNKADKAVKLFELIHSVDRLSLGRALSKAARRSGIEQAVLMQVNISGEATKSGVALDLASELFAELRQLPNIKVKGLMAIGSAFPPGTPDEIRRSEFRALRKLRDELEQQSSSALPELSMGMSGDFEEAIEEGATLVRVGSALFGERPQ